MIRSKVDLRESAGVVEDQYYLGSCSANAIANAYEMLVMQYNPTTFTEISRLFIYYNARLIEGTVNDDSGAFISDALEGVQKYGLCSESLWPYNVEKFNVEPTSECYENAKSRSISNVKAIETIKQTLETINRNQPVVFGIMISADFQRVGFRNSVIEMPTPENEKTGHAMSLVGYDLDKKLFLAKNSFGPAWGDRGYCWIPFDYMEEKAYDAWTFSLP